MAALLTDATTATPSAAVELTAPTTVFVEGTHDGARIILEARALGATFQPIHIFDEHVNFLPQNVNIEETYEIRAVPDCVGSLTSLSVNYTTT